MVSSPLSRHSGGRAVLFVGEGLLGVDGRRTLWIDLCAGVRAQRRAQPLLFGLLDVLPFDAFGPRALAFGPRAADRLTVAVAHVERDVLEARVSGKLAGRKVDRKLVERGGELLIMRDLAGHQKGQRVLHTWIVGELLQVLVDYLRPRFRGEITAQVHRRVSVGVDERAGPVV